MIPPMLGDEAQPRKSSLTMKPRWITDWKAKRRWQNNKKVCLRVSSLAEAGLDEIDLVLSHSRDEDHLHDPQDIPQVNLVSIRPGSG